MLFKRKSIKSNSQPTKQEIEKTYGPIGGPNAPSSAVIEARRKPHFIVNPKDVAPEDDIKVRLWAAKIMNKYESKLSEKYKENEIINSGDVEPEDIDIRNIYPFKDLHWIIFRKDGIIAYDKLGNFSRNSKKPKQVLFHLLLICKAPKSGNMIKLCDVAFAKI